MAQKYTSSATSINSSKLPAVYGKAHFSAPFVLDYGCGKYTDHIADALHAQGRELFPYDPFNQPKEINLQTIERMKLSALHRIPVDIVCSNVLNVIDDDKTVQSIAEKLEKFARDTGGSAYITVYEGDRSGNGRQTGSDQYQRNEPLRSYLRFFRDAVVRNGMIVIENNRSFSS